MQAVDQALKQALVETIDFPHGPMADTWAVARDADLLRRTASALADPFRNLGVQFVASIEVTGFIFGVAVALELEAGFITIRKGEGLLAGNPLKATTRPDYRGRVHSLRVQKHSIRLGDRVLLVDDWIETGHQIGGARELLVQAGATVVGTAVVVNETSDTVAASIDRFHFLVRADDLTKPPATGSQ